MIRRPLLLSPLAIAASACALRPWTPSVSVAFWSQAPDVHDTDLPARADALRRWTLPPSDPWAGYAKYTLLTVLDEAPERTELPVVEALDDVRKARAAGEHVAAIGLPPDTLWMADMRGAASVAFGTALSHGARDPVALVPTFNNWPDDDEIVPAEETLAALVRMSPTLPAEGATGERPVFLLDAWRLAYRFDQPDDETYDNRYILSQNDLPDGALLRARAIHSVVYVVTSLDDAAVEEDDLHATFMDWRAAGLAISMVDLDTLLRTADRSRWGSLLQAHRLDVAPRTTILDDAAFYARARGGFGGVHARPGEAVVSGVKPGGRGRGG